ncbi:MAG: tRNA pseudouridine(38-40) synthase TruA [Firmicutes bacterium]|nr:tRNA pseudouridine(38-40) synthase TruA [Bacillota bacterium]MCM1400875.1 tRNA pseudouridine(38-40) synthase TruA [Bacteroides sp.]MCM1476630.1 tRNA pseudouridine(38-40) synthase TruA [Bacteroides sp.]
MQRYFMRLAYRGAPFHGWQRQPNAISVQQTIEEALATVLRVETPIVGAGRTDTGVNARMMMAHFDTAQPIVNKNALIRSLNTLTGPDIAIEQLIEVHSDAHARFDATSRTYHYYAIPFKSPFFHEIAWRAPANLDYGAMNRAASLLLSTSDFTSFAKLHTDTRTNICHVTRAEWKPVGIDSAHVFIITADRFLRNMVRAVVGTLVDVGRGKITLNQFKEIIDKRNRCAAGTSMPPQALYLWDVTYPYF